MESIYNLESKTPRQEEKKKEMIKESFVSALAWKKKKKQERTYMSGQN